MIIGNMWISLTKIDHNGTTFSKYKIFFFKYWYFSSWIHLKIWFGSLLSLENVDVDECAWYLCDIYQGLYSSAWLTA